LIIPVQNHHSRIFAARRRPMGDELLRQRVIVIGKPRAHLVCGSILPYSSADAKGSAGILPAPSGILPDGSLVRQKEWFTYS
jgi:hypothetical protein